MYVSRNNYEEFFLLYVDNELSFSGKKAVEQFLEDNPDLREEFNALLDSKLSPDNHIIFDHKQSLLKFTEDLPGINLTNYESYFLLYTDNELNAAERKAVEQFAAQNPALGSELSLFMQARMEPDQEVVFEQKGLLYRHEKARRILVLPWMRWAAAALVLLLAGLVVLYTRTNSGVRPSLAKNQAFKNQNKADSKKNNQPAVTPPSAQPLHYSEDRSGKGGGVQPLTRPGDQYANIDRSSDNQRSVEKEISDGTSNRKDDSPERGRMLLASIAPVIQDSGKSFQPGQMDQVNHPLAGGSEKVIVQDVPAGGPEVNPYAKQASISELLPNNEDGIKIMAFSAKKNTMRGLLRKVTRVFDKTTNVDNDSKQGVLIGNIQVPFKQSNK